MAIVRLVEAGAEAEGRPRTALELGMGVGLMGQGRATGLHPVGLMHLKIWFRLKVHRNCMQCMGLETFRLTNQQKSLNCHIVLLDME